MEEKEICITMIRKQGYFSQISIQTLMIYTCLFTSLFYSTGMCLSELQNDPELLEIWTSLVDCRNFTGTCDEDDPYRSADGSCNNLDYPEWGKSFTPQERFVPAHYEDGMYTQFFEWVKSFTPGTNFLSSHYEDGT